MGGSVRDQHAGLCDDLRLVRLNGIHRARVLSIPSLLHATERLGHLLDGTPRDLAVEALLRQAVDRLGHSPEAEAAMHSFGLAQGRKLAKAADRRRAAARAQGVSVETFRKSYEPTLIDQLANEILALVTQRAPASNDIQARSAEPGLPIPEREPVFSQEHHLADVLRTAHANADWDLVEGVYQQCVEIAEDHDGRFMPDAIPAFFAEALGRMSANYHGREEELILHGLAILGNAEHATRITPSLFKQLYADDRFDRFVQYSLSGDPRRTHRRPCPFEALVETARRFRDLNHLQAALADLPTSCILGGSVNYGRYFSVHGNSEQASGSNVDVIIVIPDYAWLGELITGLAELPGGAQASRTELEQRAEIWREHRLDDGYTLFSQRIQMWSDEDDPVMAWAPNRGEYPMDLHIVSGPVLDWILVADSAKLTASGSGNSRSVRDFCQQGDQRDEHQRSFSGRNLRTRLEVTELPAASVLRTHRAYSIQADRYYPGSVQNLILPRFNKRWDEVPIRGALETFRWKIIERLRYERRQQPYELQRVSLSHTRAEGFAPHILRSVDSDAVT